MEGAPISERLKWKKRPNGWPRTCHGRRPANTWCCTSPALRSRTRASGKVIYEEKFGSFKEPEKGWTVTTSKTNTRASFSNEGKAGEIMALPDTSVSAERDWPAGAASVELTLDAGDDTISNAWGPGIALVATDGSTVNFIIRPNQQVFETPSGLAGRFDRDKPVRLPRHTHPGQGGAGGRAECGRLSEHRQHPVSQPAGEAPHRQARPRRQGWRLRGRGHQHHTGPLPFVGNCRAWCGTGEKQRPTHRPARGWRFTTNSTMASRCSRNG